MSCSAAGLEGKEFTFCAELCALVELFLCRSAYAPPWTLRPGESWTFGIGSISEYTGSRLSSWDTTDGAVTDRDGCKR